MKLLSISIRNFRLHAATDITFPTGIVGILGDNEAGKSTILEAATWALFGGDATRGTKAGIRWHGAPARQTASVTLWFEIGGKRYRVDRGETSAKLFEGGTLIVDGVAAVNAYVPTLLGLTHNEFTASFFVKQKDVTRLASMLPTERVAFIRSLMGMSKIDAALKTCRARKTELSQEREGLTAGLGERRPLADAAEDAATRALAAEAARYEAIKAEQAATGVMGNALAVLRTSSARKGQHEAHAAALQQGRSAREAAGLEVERLTAKLAQVGDARTRLAEGEAELAAVPALRRERDGLVAARAAVSERETLTVREAELVREVAYLNEVIADAERQLGLYDLDAGAAANRAAKAADEKLAGLRAMREQERARLHAEAEAHRKEAVRHQRRIEAIQAAGPAGDCPTCARRLGDAYTEVVKLLSDARAGNLGAAARLDDTAAALADPSDDELEAEAERDAATAEVERHRTLRQDAGTAGKVIAERGRDLAKAEDAMTKVRARLSALLAGTFDANRLNHVESELGRLDRLDRALAGDRALVAQEQETRTLLGDRRRMLEAAEQTISDSEAGLREVAFDAGEHARLEAAGEEARQAAERARIALARADEAERNTRAQVQAARKALADYDSRAIRLEEVTAAHLRHERTAARLADFRVAIAATIRPEMEELMSGFVHLLTDGRHEAVTLTEDFEAVLHESGVPVEVVSGGCEDIAALAMRLALSQMIAERAGHPLSLLILDEPFGSLSETRRGNVLSLIRRLRGVFSQVLVISHVGETRDAVDHVVELEFDEAERKAILAPAPDVVGREAA